MTRPIDEREAVSAAVFEDEIATAFEPVVLRGFARDWPLVAAARQSDAALATCLRSADEGVTAETFRGDEAIGGRFHYRDDIRSFNFERRALTVSALLDEIEAAAAGEDGPALYMGSVPLAEIAPRLAADHPNPVLPGDIPARLWLGNAITVSAHYDLSDNIAVVAGGRRRFTVFPPDQVGNLYVGPLDFTVAGQPISMVDVDDPDLDRFPRFAAAMDAARTAELEPGDAIYIPALWWHHVRSLAPLNALVNYWWDPSPAGTGTAFEAMVHGVLGLRDLPPARRAAFKAMFDHYVFREDGDPVAHLPEAGRGILGPPTPALRDRIRGFLANGLMRALKRSG